MNFTETSTFTDTVAALVDQISDLDAAALNAAAQALANRTRFLYDLSSLAGMKTPVTCATTASISLAGTQTIDGVTLIAGQSVLVKNQAGTYENGIYVVATGAWSRRFDCNSAATANAAVVSVISGTVNAKSIWHQTAVSPVIGSSAVTWERLIPVDLTHTHTNNADIGGPYSLAAHTHLNNSSIGGPFVVAADFTSNFATNGYCRMPNGLYLQWGQSTGDSQVNFAPPFPTALLSLTANTTVNGPSDYSCNIVSMDKTKFTISIASHGGGYIPGGAMAYNWMAIGY